MNSGILVVLVLGVVLSATHAASIPERPLVGGEAMVSAAQAAESRSDWQDAIRRYETLISKHPRGEYEARSLLAIAGIQSGPLKDAEGAVRTCQKLLSEVATADTMSAYSAAQKLITLSDQISRPELRCQAYQAMLDSMKGSVNRSSWYSGLIGCAVRKGDVALARDLVSRMLTDCAGEPSLPANAETASALMAQSAAFEDLASDLRRRIQQLPSGTDPAKALHNEYKSLVEKKDYAAAIAKADALAQQFPQNHYTHLTCMDAQAVAETHLKDWSINQRMCRLAAKAARGDSEGDTPRVALLYWMRASTYLKDIAAAREAADYALANYPHSGATDDMLLQAAKAPLQKGAAWIDADVMEKGLREVRFILERYPGGTAELEARWLEKRLEKMIALERQALSK